MAIAEMFPYSDQHNLNLDWIIMKIKEFSGNQISGISVTQIDSDTIKFVVTYTDGSTRELDDITLPQGPQGETGPEGPEGPEGPQGPIGPAGGVDSVNGFQGNVIIEYDHRNLLDNGWFTVNQRADSTYGAGVYTVDRWKTNGTAAVAVNLDKTITLTGNGGNGDLIQYIGDTNVINSMWGKDITLTAVIDGAEYTATGTIPGSAPSPWTTICSNIQTNFRIQLEWNNNSMWQIVVRANTGISVTIKAVKLELGDKSTLKYDAAPSYEEELAKCQRYFYRATPDNAAGLYMLGFMNSTTQIRGMFSLPTTLRTAPAISIGNATKLAVRNYEFSRNNIGVTSMTYQSFFGSSLCLIAVTNSGTLNQYEHAMLFANNDTTYIDFVADL